MAIKEEKALTLAEVVNLAQKNEKGEEIKKFISTFVKIDAEKAQEIRAELEALNLIKLKDSTIVKIIDFLPKDTSELNKVLSDVSLDSDEITKILNVTGKY
jgi:DNA-directed RNA polymerase subunit F